MTLTCNLQLLIFPHNMLLHSTTVKTCYFRHGLIGTMASMQQPAIPADEGLGIETTFGNPRLQLRIQVGPDLLETPLVLPFDQDAAHTLLEFPDISGPWIAHQ